MDYGQPLAVFSYTQAMQLMQHVACVVAAPFRVAVRSASASSASLLLREVSVKSAKVNIKNLRSWRRFK